MKRVRLALIGAVACLIAPVATAGQYVYPAKGQDQATQAKDEAECSTWATQQTGFTPGQAKAASGALGALTGTPRDTSAVTSALGATPGGAVPGGAVPGGMGGAASAAGALMGTAGGGAGVTSALGAIPGSGLGGASGVLGSAGSLGGVAQTAGLVNQAIGKPQSSSSAQADYDKARAACLNGRGYSVQ